MGEFDTGFTFYVGNMFGGKTAQMIDDLETAQKHLGRKVQVFKPCIDDRYSRDYISANEEKLTFPAIEVSDASDIENHLVEGVEVVGIDELQFFDKRVADFIREYKPHIRIFGTGLFHDYRGEPFHLRKIGNSEIDSEFNIGHILSLVDPLDSLDQLVFKFPKCTEKVGRRKCGRLAQYIQRVNEDGSFSEYGDRTIIVGSTNKYFPRCKDHFVKPFPETLK